MCSPPCAGRRASRAGIAGIFAGLLLSLGLAAQPSAAACLPDTDPLIRSLQTLVDQDANAALKKVAVLLKTELASPIPNTQRLASLYSVQAQAYSILELESKARDAVFKGLKFAIDNTDPVRIMLLSLYAENVYDQAGIAAAMKVTEEAQAVQKRGSLEDICLLIGRGLLQYRGDREDLAIGSLTQAYRSSTTPAFAESHVLAAGVLATVLRGMGDYSQALALNQEAIDWDISQRASLALSVDRFLRGRILILMEKYSQAINEFEDARKLSAMLNDTQGVAFADVRICESRIELGQLIKARSSCENALFTFIASRFSDEVKDTEALLARIDLAEGHPEKALATLNEVLDHSGTDVMPLRVASLYQWRARTNAALHNYHDAYNDLAEYMRRYVATNDADRTKQAVALRARFETDREIERNATLKRELDLSHEQSQRQAQQLRWNAIAAVSATLVIALLIYFLITNLRFRQQLVRLASQDGLTGLPNRRRTSELATDALVAATASEKPLTIAIIDMDHFKFINDRCGHATGDYVLREFARLGRESVRAADVLGRWGGEEFLLIMPDATPEVAMATLERLRTLVFGITLPPSGAGLRVSLSAGLAMREKQVRSLDELIARADAALYTAKNEGRDLVRIADEKFLTTSGIRRATRQ
ncbi:MAG TPA: diguanylate cyclase [Steroidobacteraceae bacterium]|jgi:diguanylate cyclase (GGDEF)-like protein|nr:diguanylate cyclase [Steroidobacteraceae bacterium]